MKHVDFSGMNPEILAPGGSPLHVRAAVEEGAHSVYVGPERMSGRSGYTEMSLDDVRESRKITADAGANLFIAINRSIPIGAENRWRKLLEEIADLKPDALIVGSFCVFNLIREMKIDIPLHASTFMGIYNAEGVRFAKSLGFSRIILNTGLYADEMGEIIKKVPDMDYELIAYGGICFNDNHRCNLPHGLREITPDGEGEEMAGNRLRTRESTYCQLRMMVTDNGGDVVKRGRLMCYPVIDLSPTLPVFMRMGINHFKIAGRERTPEFVRTAVKALKNGIERAKEYGNSAVENFAYLVGS